MTGTQENPTGIEGSKQDDPELTELIPDLTTNIGGISETVLKDLVIEYELAEACFDSGIDIVIMWWMVTQALITTFESLKKWASQNRDSKSGDVKPEAFQECGKTFRRSRISSPRRFRTQK